MRNSFAGRNQIMHCKNWCRWVNTRAFASFSVLSSPSPPSVFCKLLNSNITDYVFLMAKSRYRNCTFYPHCGIFLSFVRKHRKKINSISGCTSHRLAGLPLNYLLGVVQWRTNKSYKTTTSVLHFKVSHLISGQLRKEKMYALFKSRLHFFHSLLSCQPWRMVLSIVGEEEGAGSLLLSVLMETGNLVLSAASWELLDGHKEGGGRKGTHHTALWRNIATWVV